MNFVESFRFGYSLFLFDFIFFKVHYTHFNFQNYNKLLELLDYLSDSFNTTSQAGFDAGDADERVEPVYFKEENTEMLDEMSMNLEQVIKENMAKSQMFKLDDFEF